MSDQIVARFDRSELPERAEITADGYLRADAVLTRTGVFQYVNQDGSIRRELRHPEDVFDATSIRSFKLLPITNDHPPPRQDGLRIVDAKNAKSLAIGFTGENVRAEGDQMRASVVVTDAEGVAAVQAGRRFLSNGYTARLEDGPGTYNGERYDFRQRDIRGNHVAIVDSPRAGEVAQIRLDGNQVEERTDANEESRLRHEYRLNNQWRADFNPDGYKTARQDSAEEHARRTAIRIHNQSRASDDPSAALKLDYLEHERQVAEDRIGEQLRGEKP